MITIERSVDFGQGHRPRRVKAPMSSVGRVSRASRLMALAIRLDRLIREGVVADQAELARLGRVSRARLTQIVNLLNLAPDIQEQVLFLPPSLRGRDAVTEQDLRPIAAVADWGRQRRMWANLART